MASHSDAKTSRTAGSDKPSTDKEQKLAAKARKRVLDPEEAEAGGPAGIAVCGEEDPGSALEFLVDDDEQNEKKKQ